MAQKEMRFRKKFRDYRGGGQGGGGGGGGRHHEGRHEGRHRYNNAGESRHHGNDTEDFPQIHDPRLRKKYMMIRDRHLILAKEALSSGDRVAAENHFQHADHYFRVLNLGKYNAQQKNGAEETVVNEAEIAQEIAGEIGGGAAEEVRDEG